MIVDDTWTNDFALRNMIKGFKIQNIAINIKSIIDGHLSVSEFKKCNKKLSVDNINLIIMD